MNMEKLTLSFNVKKITSDFHVFFFISKTYKSSNLNTTELIKGKKKLFVYINLMNMEKPALSFNLKKVKYKF